MSTAAINLIMAFINQFTSRALYIFLRRKVIYQAKKEEMSKTEREEFVDLVLDARKYFSWEQLARLRMPFRRRRGYNEYLPKIRTLFADRMPHPQSYYYMIKRFTLHMGNVYNHLPIKMIENLLRLGNYILSSIDHK